MRAPWGDPALGGRLFDDLFYQWVLDQNGPFEVDDMAWSFAPTSPG